MRPDISFNSGASIAIPASSMRARTGVERPLDLAVDLLELGAGGELGREQGSQVRGARGALGEPSVGRLDRVLRGQHPVDDPGVFVGGGLAAEALEHERLEIGAAHPGREHVLGQAHVEELRGRAAAGRLEEAIEGLRVRDRELRAGTFEGGPALADLGGGPPRSRRSNPVPAARRASPSRVSSATPAHSPVATSNALPFSRRFEESAACATSPWISAAREWNSSSTKVSFSFSGSGAERFNASVSNGMGRSVLIAAGRRDSSASSLCSRRLSPTLPLTSSARASSSVEAAVFLDPLLCRDLADAGHARDVVGGVAHEGQDVDDLPGRDAEELLDALVVEKLLLARVEDPHAGPLDELEHVLVRRDDDDVEIGCPRRPGERADDVVGLVARQGEDGDPVGLARAADLGDLGGQVLVHRGPVRLVGVVLVVADGLARQVEGHRQILARMLAEHLPQHRHEAVDGVGRPPVPGREAPDRVVRPVDVGHRVHEVDGRARRRHGNGILWRAEKGRGGGPKPSFGAGAAHFRGIAPRRNARGRNAKPEFAQPVALEIVGGKKQIARPVPGVARFNLRSLRNCPESVKRNLRSAASVSRHEVTDFVSVE